MSGACTEHGDVFSGSATKLKTEVLLEDSDPEPRHGHLPSEFQSQCGNKKQGPGKWEVEQGLYHEGK